jgi:1,4-dihydroxy-2-naphthoyl-CoA hydrolase
MPEKSVIILDPDHETSIRELFRNVAFARLLGLSIDSMSPGRLAMSMPMRPELGQLLGFAHGGAVAGLVDTAASFCWRTLLPIEAKAVAIELKHNFLRPITGGTVRAEAEMVHSGSRTGVILVRVLTENGKLAGLATVTYMRIG